MTSTPLVCLLSTVICLFASGVGAQEAPATGTSGRLSFILTRAEGTSFFKVEVEEKDGQYRAQVASPSGAGAMRAQITPERVLLPGFGIDLERRQKTDKNMRVEIFRGPYTRNRRAEFKAYTSLKKHQLRIEAAIGEHRTTYAASERSFTVEFPEEGTILEGRKIKGEPGNCEGSIVASANPTQRLMDFYCESEGSLKDALFTQAAEVIAWLLPFLL